MSEQGQEESPRDEAPEVDVSDLKTYDVPDPPLPPTTWLRVFAAAPIGIALALGFARLVAADHYFAVAGNRQERARDRDCARRFINELPPEVVKERVLAIEDAEKRGAFHKVLAGSGDPSQADAIFAFLATSDGKRDLEPALESLRSFPQQTTAPRLVELWGKLSDYEGKRVQEEIEKHYEAEHALKAVLAIEEPKKRGRWFKLLPLSKDPEQIDAILAYVKTQSSRISGSGSAPRGRYGFGSRYELPVQTQQGGKFREEAQALIAFGEPATKKLKEALHEEDRTIVNLAAEALSKVNLEFLTSYCQEELTAYDKSVYGPKGLYWASMVKSAKTRGNAVEANKFSAADLAEAERALTEGDRHSFRIQEMLKAMERIEGEKQDFCFIRGLSSFSQAVAEYCAKTLDTRLTTERLIDVMFSYIAQKTSFRQDEVDVYEKLLLKTKGAGAIGVARNLERLLREAKGRPDQVFFLYKKMGFRVLQEHGTKAELPTLEKFKDDPDSYVHTRTSNTGLKSETEIKFKVVVQQTINAIKARRR